MNYPKVSIICTTYLEKTKPYLDLAVSSIKNLNYPKECLDIILVGRKGYMPTYDGVRTVCPVEAEFHNPAGLNCGIAQSQPDSQYFFILNDDVVLTPNCLQIMVAYAQPDTIINPIELDPEAGSVVPAGSRTPGLYPQAHLCMFATLMPKQIWQTVKNGTTPDSIGFDENFKTGQDDVDYSWRARDAKFYNTLCTQSAVWHFGGTSANSTISNKLRAENLRYFRSKWGCLPPNISEECLRMLEANEMPWK